MKRLILIVAVLIAAAVSHAQVVRQAASELGTAKAQLQELSEKARERALRARREGEKRTRLAIVTDIAQAVNELAAAQCLLKEAGKAVDSGAEKARAQEAYDTLESARVKLTGRLEQLEKPTAAVLRDANAALGDLEEKASGVLDSLIQK